MNKFFVLFFVSLGIFLSSFVIYAQKNENVDVSKVAPEVSYPIAELESCKNKTECFAYCELASNGKQCLAFAKKYQLFPEEEIRVAEKVLDVKGGPGGCNSKDSCEDYCDDVANIEVCIAFAEENGLMKGKDLEEAKKVRAMIQNGKKLPGGCRNKDACENYCENTENIKECLAFAEESGFLSPEELEQAKKFMPLMKSGQTPGGCKSRDECEAYCESDEHFNECISFAEKNGMIPEEERKNIEAFKKAGGKGPGGCKGKQCQAFCEQPDNQQACFEWAKENGMLKEDDLRRMEEGRKQIEKTLKEAPPEVVACLEKALGPGGLEKMRSGEFFGGEATGEKMSVCFEGFMSQIGGDFNMGDNDDREVKENRQDKATRENFNGPGGCKGPDECMLYCKNNLEECKKFAPPQREREMNNNYNNRDEGMDDKDDDRDRNEESDDKDKKMRFKNGRFSSPDEFPGEDEFNEKFKEFPVQNQQNFQQQFQPPSGEIRPSEGSYIPPASGTNIPNEGSYQPPSGEMFTQPQSKISTINMLGLILGSFLELLR